MNRLSSILWVIAFIFLGIFAVQKISTNFFLFADKVAVVEPIPQVLNVASPNSSMPGPLKATSTRPTSSRQSATISARDVITFTNKERVRAGLAALGENTILDQAALYKAKDMLKRKYFAHVAPDGETMSTIATREGYAYLVVGENLALGDFSTAASLVDAWMNSPGHRANILNGSYREIGVAVAQGIYEGQLSIVSVQVFATPRSVCPIVDATIKTRLDAQEAALTAAHKTLDTLKGELESLRSTDPDLYNQKVSEFNARVADYNNFVERQKQEVAEYNKTVTATNKCIQVLQ